VLIIGGSLAFIGGMIGLIYYMSLGNKAAPRTNGQCESPGPRTHGDHAEFSDDFDEDELDHLYP